MWLLSQTEEPPEVIGFLTNLPKLTSLYLWLFCKGHISLCSRREAAGARTRWGTRREALTCMIVSWLWASEQKTDYSEGWWGWYSTDTSLFTLGKLTLGTVNRSCFRCLLISRDKGSSWSSSTTTLLKWSSDPQEKPFEQLCATENAQKELLTVTCPFN